MFRSKYKIIKKSGLFDEKYYLTTYEDIRKKDLDPIKHYIKFGWKEGRNPSSYFETNFYLENNNDVKKNKINPLIHYILHGSKEGRKINRLDDIHFEEYDIIKKSHLFDEKYYLEKYPDTIAFDSIKHYIQYGWKEGRNPSRKFNTNFYLRNNEDVKIGNINPLIHYIKYGEIEKRNICGDEKDFCELISLFNKEIVIYKFVVENPIDIIIPVYNGFQFLEPLIKSIIKNTSMNYRIIICDDKSSDDNVLPLLKQLKEKNPLVNITLLENEENLGFIKTVNKLVKYTNNHFVLLNTDTEVPPFWIERLMYPIFKMKNIASTTPFTNAGTICSFPNYLEDNTIFENMNVEDLDKYFQYINFEKTFIEIPTGVGFCMGVNKNLVDKIGMFDEIFGKGYGEENDWCQRAIKEGYLNLHITNLFVYHKHGGSFLGEEKKKLIERNSIELSKKFPNYNSDVAKLISRNELDELREIIVLRILCYKYNVKVFITHSLGGGADEYINSYLNENTVVLKFTYNCLTGFGIEILFKDKKSYKFSLKNYQYFSKLIEEFNLKDIYINNLVSYPDILDFIKYLINIKEKLNLNFTYLVHDYYCICPMYNLLNNKIDFCNIPENISECKKCLLFNPFVKKQIEDLVSIYPELNINVWRNIFGHLLKITDNIITFSNDSKELLVKAHPSLKNENITILPHIVNWIESVDSMYSFETLRIGIIGTVTTHKGYRVISKLATFIDALGLDIELHIFGEIVEPYESISICKCSKVHGKYNKIDLPFLIRNNNINMILISSICPETFSYTTQEAINMGLNISCFDLGAPAERLKKYDKSIILDSFEPEYIIEEIFKYFNMNLEELNEKKSQIIKNRIIFVCVSNNDLIYKNTVWASYYMDRHTVIKYDNIENNLPVTVRYNDAIKILKEKNYDGWIFFVHNDFSILEDLDNFVDNLDKSAIYGSIGAILENDKKYLYGEILQGHNGALIKHGIKIDKPVKVDTVDCQCIFFHSDLIKKYDLSFDENELLNFHQYTEEYCLKAKKVYNIDTYVVPFLCKHTSWGTLNEGYYKAEKYLQNKFGRNWAGTCTHL